MPDTWEWGTRNDLTGYVVTWPDEETARQRYDEMRSRRKWVTLVRRTAPTPAGPWQPVPGDPDA